MARISIIGGGSWGIALAVLLSRNGHEITIWSALENEIAMLKEKHEHRMLPGVVLPDNTVFTTREQEAVQGKDLLVMAVASSYTRSTARRLKELVENNQKIWLKAYNEMADFIYQKVNQGQYILVEGRVKADYIEVDYCKII